MTRPDLQALERTLRATLQRGYFDGHDVLLFHDLTGMTNRIMDVQRAFPEGSLHTVAVKANPLPRVLEHLLRLGSGLEVASVGELHLAVASGCPPDRIVFDSPIKTEAEIAEALQRGVRLNADSLAELQRIGAWLNGHDSHSVIGVRINPQVGTGRIAMSGVAGTYSKFGIPLTENRDDIVRAFDHFPWLTGLHVHIGSQGCSLDLLSSGVQKVWELAEQINTQFPVPRLVGFDLGGGLPVDYADGDSSPTPAEYARRLHAMCPSLFNGQYYVLTEFGRYIHANAGWVASRVEYVKPSQYGVTAMIHVGADLLLRKCYAPNEWHHDLAVADPSGHLKDGPLQPYVVAGPLCFAGDIIEHSAHLPTIQAGDILIIRDTGAYTLAMWSRYNSRLMPRVVGYWNDGEKCELLKERETPEDVWQFWGGRASSTSEVK